MNRTQKKTLVLLLGILVGLGILLAVVSAVKRSSAQREAEEAAAQDAASVITETEAAYSSLTYDNGNATLSFHLDEAGKWVWSDDPEFPLDDSTIQSILTLLTNLKPQQTITEGDTLEAYGLDQPFATLTAAKPDGGTLTISLGNTTTDGNSYYMLMTEQESPVYIISNSHLGCQRRGRHRQRGHRLSAGGAGGADLHQMRGLQAHRRGRCPVRL